MKKFVLAALALATLATLGACGSNGKSDKSETTITYMNYTSSPNYTKQLDQMVKTFEKENPKIKVEVQTVPYDTYFTKIQTLLAADKAPDTFEMNYENFVSYASKNVLLDLSDYVSKDETLDMGSVNEKAFDASKYDGKQYGMTESFSNVVTYYNKDLFDKAGVAYPTSDWTWADEVGAAKKLTNSKENIWGTYSPVSMNEFYKVAAQNDGKIYDGKTLTINSEANIEALTHMTDLVTKDKVSPSPDQMSGQTSEDLFLNGQLAMVHTGIWDFGTFADASFKWDIAVEAGNKEKATHFFADSIVVSKKTKNADAAYKWAKFMSTSEAAAKIRIDASWSLPIINTKDVLSKYLEATPPANRKAVFESLDSLVLPPVSNNWQKLSEATDKEFQKVLLDQVTPKEALDTLQKEFK